MEIITKKRFIDIFDFNIAISNIMLLFYICRILYVNGFVILPWHLYISLYSHFRFEYLFMLYIFILTIWSWHIWVTERDLSSVEVENFQHEKYKFLPVNLGWCGFGNEWYAPREVKTRLKQAGGKTADLTFSQKQEVLNNDYDIKNGNNPYYQWGRKDPMLPGNGVGDADKTCYPSSPEYKFKYGSEGLNTSDIKEYIRNPYKFNINSYMDGKYYNLWSTDNDKTVPNDDVVIKSVYDPSPVGYSLPASNAFTGFTTTGQNAGNGLSSTDPLTPENYALFNVKGDFNKGWTIYNNSTKQKTTFYLTAGYRAIQEGKVVGIFNDGNIWSAGPIDGNRVFALDFHPNNILPLAKLNKGFGLFVRSAEEKKWKMMCVGGSCNTKPEMDGKYYNLWSMDNDKTVPNDEVVIKSVYDPSPVGYSLPTSNAFTGFTTTGQTVGSPTTPATPEQINVKLPFDKGYYFYTKLNNNGSLLYLPAIGLRFHDSGKLNWTNNSGCYWLSIPYIIEQARPLFFNFNRIVPMGSNYRNFAMAVRSAEEK